MKILVVEDEELLRALAVDAFDDAGFEVIEAATGEDAVARCKEHIADALFTDIRLPGKIDGWDIAEQCRIANPRLPVVYATGYNIVAERRVPGSRFFHKPYHPEEVIQAIRELLRDSSPE
jgi:CheY-like chemotaxis protein